AGDVNGDGQNDLVVGAPLTDDNAANAGSCYVYTASTGALLFQLHGAAANDNMGYAVAGPGDVGTDGKSEVAIWVPGDDGAASDSGAVLVVTDNCPASWANYGPGWPGTNGVPSLIPSGDPVLCGQITLEIGNSRGATTVGALFIGAGKTSIPTALGGSLLVSPPWSILLITVPTTALSPPLNLLSHS